MNDTNSTSLRHDESQPDHTPSSLLSEFVGQAAPGAGHPAGSPVEAPRPWIWGRIRDVSLAILGVAGVLYVAAMALQLFTGVLLLFVLAALLAFILQPVVGALAIRLGLSFATAAGIAYAAVALALGIAAFWGVSLLLEEVTTVIANLPAIFQAVQQRIPDLQARAQALGIDVDVVALQSQLRDNVPAAGLATHGLAWAAKAGDVALNAFLVLFLSFYLVLDGDRLVRAIYDVAPAQWKPYVRFTQQSLLRVVGGYLRGQLVMGAIVGVSVFVACLLLGVRYSLVLGVLGFFFEMVPMVGPTLIGVAMTGVALLTSFKVALLALGFYLLLQMVESNVLGPRITGHAVGLHPIASMLGLVAGAKLFGLWGALFAVPVLGFAFVVIAAVYRQVRGEDPLAVFQPHRPPAWRIRAPTQVLGRWRHQTVSRPGPAELGHVNAPGQPAALDPQATPPHPPPAPAAPTTERPAPAAIPVD